MQNRIEYLQSKIAALKVEYDLEAAKKKPYRLDILRIQMRALEIAIEKINRKQQQMGFV